MKIVAAAVEGMGRLGAYYLRCCRCCLSLDFVVVECERGRVAGSDVGSGDGGMIA